MESEHAPEAAVWLLTVMSKLCDKVTEALRGPNRKQRIQDVGNYHLYYLRIMLARERAEAVREARIDEHKDWQRWMRRVRKKRYLDLAQEGQ